MWSSSRCTLPNAFLYAVSLAAIGNAGCGTNCIQGFFNGGNGGGFVSTGTPQSCPLPNVTGTMNAVVLKTVACENCTDAASVRHLFVTLRSVQLRPSPPPDPTPGMDSPDWIELAPRLAGAPLQIDLIGNSSEILVENASVPAGTYREIRVQFLSPSNESIEEPVTKDAAGPSRSNFLVTADGHIQPLHWAGDASELVIPFGTTPGDSLLVLPGSTVNLRLRLEARPVFVSSPEGLKVQYILAGKAEAIRASSPEAVEDSTH